ncbi:hypothetical protein SGLAM104S_01294 [Streptomyces glaucescens]
MSISNWVSSSMPTAATRKPGPISSRGGTRVSRRVPIWVEPVIMPATIGRKAKPVSHPRVALHDLKVVGQEQEQTEIATIARPSER